MTTPTLRDRVFDSVSGYSDAKAVIAHVDSLSLPTDSDAKQERAAIFGRVHGLLVSGDPIPDEIPAALLSLELMERNRTEVSKIVSEVVAAAKQTVEFALPMYTDTAYRILDTDLQKLVKRVKSLLPDLNGATTSTDAITNGPAAVDAWRTLNALAAEYDDIRSVQHEILPRELNYWDRLTTTGLYKDALSVHPYFTRRFHQNSNHDTPHGLGNAIAPLSADQSWWPDDVDRPTALLRIVTTTTPWVPTPAVMEELYQRALTAVGPISLDNPRPERERRVAAHDEYLARL